MLLNPCHPPGLFLIPAVIPNPSPLIYFPHQSLNFSRHPDSFTSTYLALHFNRDSIPWTLTILLLKASLFPDVPLPVSSLHQLTFVSSCLMLPKLALPHSNFVRSSERSPAWNVNSAFSPQMLLNQLSTSSIFCFYFKTPISTIFCLSLSLVKGNSCHM